MSTDASLRSNDDKVATGIFSTKTDVSGFLSFFSPPVGLDLNIKTCFSIPGQAVRT